MQTFLAITKAFRAKQVSAIIVIAVEVNQLVTFSLMKNYVY